MVMFMVLVVFTSHNAKPPLLLCRADIIFTTITAGSTIGISTILQRYFDDVHR
jgi:hypothetical protein